jgi:hypothetical protein
MQKQTKFFPSIGIVAIVTAIILMIPLIAMQFTNEVNWSVADFIVMGILLFSTGTAYVFISRQGANFVYKAAVAASIGTTFLLIWVNLAVGLIGSGPHAGNMTYIGVVAVVIFGTFLSRFTARGMELTMFAASFSLVLVAVIALVTGMQNYPASSVGEIIGVNAFFAMLFAISGLLFRYVAMNPSTN